MQDSKWQPKMIDRTEQIRILYDCETLLLLADLFRRGVPLTERNVETLHEIHARLAAAIEQGQRR
jgi:hypothetical protein